MEKKIKINVRRKHINHGEQNDSTYCPIGLAIRDQMPEALNISVGARTIVIDGAVYHAHDRVKRFVSAFDLRGKKGVSPKTFVVKRIK